LLTPQVNTHKIAAVGNISWCQYTTLMLTANTVK